jgi:hypothetical protein
MKREWLPDELAEQWTLSPTERKAVGNKAGSTRLGFAVLLKFFQVEGRFPRDPQEVPLVAVEYVAPQVGLSPGAWGRYAWDGRTVEYHRAQIRRLLGFREATLSDAQGLDTWLQENVLARERLLDRVKDIAREWYRDLRIEPPSPDQVDRVVRSAIHNYEEHFCTGVLKQLSPDTTTRLDELLAPMQNSTAAPTEAGVAALHYLSTDPGRAGLRSIEEQVAKLNILRAVSLPADVFPDTSSPLLKSLRDRAVVEEAFELRRHPESLRRAMLAAFCRIREQEVVDELIDLLIATVHKIGAKAERRVEEEAVEEFKRVAGKHELLCRVAEVSLAHPDGLVREVVYPVVNEETLRAIIKEAQATGAAYREKVQMVIRSSYRGHYRRMVPLILRALDFRSNNESHQPVIRALALLSKYAGTKVRTYPPEEEVPIEGVVRSAWVDAVVEQHENKPRVDRIAYEVCALQALRDRLRCKEVWVVGANRFRNPDEDLPKDFEQRRTTYFASLKLPTRGEEFVAKVRREMTDALTHLDATLPNNPHMRILSRGGGRISLSPLEAQAEPSNLVALKVEMNQR